MLRASVGHSRDGYHLSVVEAPLWALLAESWGEWLCEHTGNVLCAAGLPGWVWKVGIGRWDEDGWPRWNVGSAVFGFGQWFHTIAVRRERRVVRLDVAAEWVQEHFPQVRESFAFLED